MVPVPQAVAGRRTGASDPWAGTGRWGGPVAACGAGGRGLAARRWCRLCCSGCCSQGVVASNRRACVATSWGRRRWTCSRTCSRGPRTTTRSPEVAWYDENDGSQSRGTSSSLSRTTPSPSSRPTWTATAMRRRSGRALGDDTVAWYANDGSQSSTERTITTLADGPTDTPRRVIWRTYTAIICNESYVRDLVLRVAKLCSPS